MADVMRCGWYRWRGVADLGLIGGVGGGGGTAGGPCGHRRDTLRGWSWRGYVREGGSPLVHEQDDIPLEGGRDHRALRDPGPTREGPDLRWPLAGLRLHEHRAVCRGPRALPGRGVHFPARAGGNKRARDLAGDLLAGARHRGHHHGPHPPGGQARTRYLRPLPEEVPKGAHACLQPATGRAALSRDNVAEARLVVLTVPDAIAARLAIERAKALAPRADLLVRAENAGQLEDLGRLGVYEAVQPELEAGLELAR